MTLSLPIGVSGLASGAILKRASVYLGLLGLAYLVRESMNVLRRYLVENTCTRINKDMYVRLVAHLMKVDLSILAQDQVGALYGRITRSVGWVCQVSADQLPGLCPCPLHRRPSPSPMRYSSNLGSRW